MNGGKDGYSRNNQIEKKRTLRSRSDRVTENYKSWVGWLWRVSMALHVGEHGSRTLGDRTNGYVNNVR